MLHLSGLLHSMLELIHHDVRDGHLTEFEHIAIPGVETIDKQRQENLKQLSKPLVHHISEFTQIDQSNLLFMNLIDFLEELVLPSVQFDTFDVLEGFIDLRYTLVGLVTHLLLDVFLSFLFDKAHSHR